MTEFWDGWIESFILTMILLWLAGAFDKRE